jgi:hypothetical protein
VPDDSNVQLQPAGQNKRYYWFATLWLAVASLVPVIVVAVNVGGIVLIVWPIAALAILVWGIRRTRQMGVSVDQGRQSITVGNYFKTVVIPFSAIQEMKSSRIHVTGGPKGGPARAVYAPSAVSRNGSVVKIGAGSGEDKTGPIHQGLTRLGAQLGVPVSF